ncbi:hypothetical protein [Deinococcus peraridilitoris]|uniref:Uncharacterized protein n=1 Tax=Deinococcus peraridilitoris (strain DSM 19664 / LMG 22246 / CIP 109416 / KR-200) TaxID=937777 RepID=K9ZZ41_DEIPD|nr:hypothetical protein [Deinococcus peraridilitoris]AFZ66177.1 hypothetical protein Deipe_0586 [Deinococcus peraridilitoris DSM 19664]
MKELLRLNDQDVQVRVMNQDGHEVLGTLDEGERCWYPARTGCCVLARHFCVLLPERA